MGRIIGELQPYITVPYGVDVLWDPKASLDLAAPVDAKFIREIFTGVYAKRFRTPGTPAAGGGKASEGDRSGECQAFV